MQAKKKTNRRVMRKRAVAETQQFISANINNPIAMWPRKPLACLGAMLSGSTTLTYWRVAS